VNRCLKIAICLSLVLISAGCGRVGLVYNRLDTLARLQLGRYIDLDAAQKAQFDQHFDALWRWHRSEQLPRYAAELRQLQTLALAPISPATLQPLGDQLRRHARTLTAETLAALAPTLASLRDDQVSALLAKLADDRERQARKQARLSDAKWREQRADTAIDRLDDWAGSVTPAQRQRIEAWAAQLQRDDDQDDARDQAGRQQFETLLRQRREPGFSDRLVGFALAPFDEPEPDAARDRTRQLLADLSALATPRQREHLARRLGELADELDALATSR